MESSLAIVDFFRATHLSVKTLRHYHRIGLLELAHVDPGTGHRRYGTDQIPTAQVIRRFRSLDMPLEEIQAIINTPDLAARNELIAGHLRRLETTQVVRPDASARSSCPRLSLLEVDRAYGSLAPYVTDHALAVEGPIREYYIVGPHETSDEDQWRTEIGWPIFHTGRAVR